MRVRASGFFALWVAATVGVASAQADDYTWSNPGTTLWSAGAWSGSGSIPNSPTANITTPSSYGRLDLDGNYTVGNFTFGTSASPATATWQVVAQNVAGSRNLEITGALSLSQYNPAVASDLLFRNSVNGTLSLKIGSIDSAGRVFFGQNETAPITKLEVTGLTNISAGLVAVTSYDATFGEVHLTQDIPATESVFRVSNFRTNNTAGGVTVAGLSGTGGIVQGANAQANQTVVGTLRINTQASTSYAYNGTLVDGIGLGTNRLAVVKSGAGTQTFGGSSTYAGGTTVQGGTLLVTNSSGSGLGVGAVSVQSGATLGGTGCVALGASNTISVLAGGAIAPGANGIGTLTLDGGSTDAAILSLASGASFRFDLGAQNTSDLVAFWNYSGPSDFLLNGASIDFSGAQAGTYTLFTFYSDNGLTSTASGLTSGFNVSAFTGLEGYGASFDYGSSSITLTLNAVPEPGTIALLAAGLGFLIVRKRIQK